MTLNWLFVTVFLCWAAVVNQVKLWTIILALGFKSDAPLLFIQKDYLYFICCWCAFVVLLILAFFQTLLAPWLAIALVLGINQLIDVFSRKRGCEKYRAITSKMIEHRLSQGEDASSLREELDISDSALLRSAQALRLWEQ